MTQVNPAERLFLPEDLTLSRSWGWFLFRGILALVVGIWALATPVGAAFVFTALFAAYAFVDGIFSLIAGLKGGNKQHGWFALILSGVVGIAIGAVFFLWPGATTAAYALVKVLMIAAWAAITGVLQIAAAIRLRKQIKGEWLMGISGLLSVILGVAVFSIALSNPAVSIVAVGWMIGFYAILAAFTLIGLAFKLRSAGKQVVAA
jgi:uncharacterized membrane protein HdeD (DUF308 family)